MIWGRDGDARSLINCPTNTQSKRTAIASSNLLCGNDGALAFAKKVKAAKRRAAMAPIAEELAELRTGFLEAVMAEKSNINTQLGYVLKALLSYHLHIGKRRSTSESSNQDLWPRIQIITLIIGSIGVVISVPLLYILGSFDDCRCRSKCSTEPWVYFACCNSGDANIRGHSVKSRVWANRHR